MSTVNDPNSADNNYTGDPVSMLDTTNEEPIPLEVTQADVTKYTFFKMKHIQRFEIPRYAGGNPNGAFQFKNHICRVANEDLDEFYIAVKGLHPSDSGNIVKIRNIQNEEPVLKTIRGPMGTTDVAAAATDANRAAPKANAEHPNGIGFRSLGAGRT